MTSRNTMMIVGALVVLIALSAVNLFLLLSKGSSSDSEETTSEVTTYPVADPIFVRIGPLTINLRSDRYGERLLYTTLSLRVGNEETREIIDKYMPEIQNRLLLLLSAYTAEQLTTPEGKQQLARAVLAALEPPLADSQPPLAISAVLFTDFIVQ